MISDIAGGWERGFLQCLAQVVGPCSSPGNQSPFCSTFDMETRAPCSLHTATCLNSLTKPPTCLHTASCGQRVTYEEDCRRYSLGKRRLVDKIQGVIVGKEETRGLTFISSSEKWWGTGKGQAGTASGQWANQERGVPGAEYRQGLREKNELTECCCYSRYNESLEWPMHLAI